MQIGMKLPNTNIFSIVHTQLFNQRRDFNTTRIDLVKSFTAVRKTFVKILKKQRDEDYNNRFFGTHQQTAY